MIALAKRVLLLLARVLFSEGPPPKGTRWALYVHHLGNYMHRWILLTPWGSVRLHHILRSDADRHLHDHPFDFTSFLLTGGYIEVTPWQPEIGPLARQQKFWKRFSLVRKRAEEAHLLVLMRPVWTFVLTGPKRRNWGFHTEKGWIYYREYSAAFPEHAASTREIRP
jgi:hypothetical protein